ncbi:bifunctional riboflavin kinase/FMN adenylyltransferase [Acuticoccus sediminis]|uniref:Riboflavin biosynthesis protein n=1 Tax=Acuticoccus sediminis TaxID=2184697 RepID=A0A8B2P032_9HYPH|nr:bifunctional riboflavin kinase/FAD synthetase [Acuticoccus sediminis]RAI04431.1 bifunctional riboflavin kinase/FMN adenylyltransferase [Acuticoccus sediminis]
MTGAAHPPRRSDAPLPLAELPAELTGGVVAIGNFDGVHRGHQTVLNAAIARGRPAVGLTFEPHPRAFFSKAPIFRLTPPEEKARVMAAVGLDAMVVVPFDEALARQSAEDFVAHVLVEQMGASAVVVGHDFKFGARRRGDGDLLAREGGRHGFATETVAPCSDGGVISSTRIREHLAAGDVTAAARLLGRRYAVTAEVRHGEKRGREMGYPTANQALDPASGLRHGIYAVRVLIDGEWRDGVASYGRRPTFDNGAPLLETYVFDYSGDLYGKALRVVFERYQRPEVAFRGMEELKVQIDRDADEARAALANLAPLSDVDAALNF